MSMRYLALLTMVLFLSGCAAEMKSAAPEESKVAPASPPIEMAIPAPESPALHSESRLAELPKEAMEFADRLENHATVKITEVTTTTVKDGDHVVTTQVVKQEEMPAPETKSDWITRILTWLSMISGTALAWYKAIYKPKQDALKEPQLS